MYLWVWGQYVIYNKLFQSGRDVISQIFISKIHRLKKTADNLPFSEISDKEKKRKWNKIKNSLEILALVLWHDLADKDAFHQTWQYELD